MALRDPATGLSCAETPFYPPRGLKPSDLATCSSCRLDFKAPNAGTKGYINRGAVADGIGVDESPLASLVYNGTSYGLYDTVIWRKGAHRDFFSDTAYDMEMNLYFRNILDTTKQLALAIPITIDNSKSMSYFNELANQDPTKRTQTLETLIRTDKPVLTYKGIDLRKRNAAAPTAAPQCSDLLSNITWFVTGTTYIAVGDANRIRGASLSGNVDPPVPTGVPTNERCRSMCMIVPTISVNSTGDSRKEKPKDVYLTRALQCQRITPSEDVKGGAVYLKNQKQDNTLADELDSAAALDAPLEVAANSGIRPREIEDLLATAIGVALAVIGIIVIGYYMLKYVYKRYIPVVVSEQKLIPIFTKAKVEACKALGDTTLAAAAAAAEAVKNK